MRSCGLHVRQSKGDVSDPAGWLDRMTAQIFTDPPDRISRADVAVMARTTVDDLPHIQALWPAFEHLVGLRGRKMYASVDAAAGTYTTCTPVRYGDDPQALGLEVGVLPGGDYLRGRLVGEPLELRHAWPDLFVDRRGLAHQPAAEVVTAWEHAQLEP